MVSSIEIRFVDFVAARAHTRQPDVIDMINIKQTEYECQGRVLGIQAAKLVFQRGDFEDPDSVDPISDDNIGGSRRSVSIHAPEDVDNDFTVSAQLEIPKNADGFLAISFKDTTVRVDEFFDHLLDTLMLDVKLLEQNGQLTPA